MANLVRYGIREGIAEITLDNPPLNVLDKALRPQLADVLRELESLEDLRVLILTGSGGRAFCAGADLEETKNLTEGSAASFLDELDLIYSKLAHYPVPVIAAVNGYALGGGLHLALCCDVRLASSAAVFGAVGANIGLAYSSQTLVRLIGPARAKELAFTARHVDAEEAVRIGLCNRVLPAERLLETCQDMARQVADKSPLSTRYIKVEMNQAVDLTEVEMRELTRQHFLDLRRTDDHREAIRATLEKRPPRFGGH